MTHECNVALLQLAAHDRENFARVLPGILETISTAIATGAELLVLPEGTVPAYVLGPRPLMENEYADAYAAIEALARTNRVHIICGGVQISDGTELPENAAVVFGPDGRIAAVGKRFLWHFDRHWYRAGSSLDPVVTSLGKIGILVCADGRVPTLARELVDRGAELLVISTAWVTNAGDARQLENIQADVIARVRAWENGVPLLAANKCGVERRSVRYCGKSQVIDATGQMQAIASSHEPEIIRACITLGPAAPHRTRSADSAPLADNKSLSAGPATLRIAIAHTLAADLRDTAEWSDVDVCFVHGPQDSHTAVPGPHIVDISDYADGQVIPSPLPAVVVNDTQIADPGYLPPLRLGGIQACIWRVAEIDALQRVLLARTRALELRIYIIVLDAEPHNRSFVVDPDGVVICGTDGNFLLPQFVFAASRVTATLAAPGSDILTALQMVEKLCKTASA